MSEPKWLTSEMIVAVHEAQLIEHGGPSGIRDMGTLKSALERPRNKWTYESADLAALAAAYGYGIVKQPSICRRQQADCALGDLYFSRSQRHRLRCSRGRIRHHHSRARGRRGERGLARPLDQGQLAERLKSTACDLNCDDMTDPEKNRLSARAARYARVGANVGGRCRPHRSRAHSRRRRARRRQCGGAVARARLAQRADDEGRPAHGDHSRRPAAGICRRIAETAGRCAADGRRLRQAAHAGRIGTGLAEALRLVRFEARRRRFARPGPSRDLARRT